MSEYKLCECLTQDDINSQSVGRFVANLAVVIWAGAVVVFNWGRFGINNFIH